MIHIVVFGVMLPPVMCEVGTVKSEECICIFSGLEDGASVFLQTLTLNYRQCHNYGKKYMTLNHCRTLKFMFWCQIICKCFWNSLEQDMQLAEAIYFSHKILFPVEIHGYSCTLHICF